MAKVTGPLFSISASGKIADAMVHFNWKGISVVRQWLKPSNPQTAGQGNRRTMLGGLGRAAGHVNTLSQFAVYAREVADTGQTWLSALVKFILDNKMSTVVAYDGNWDAWAAHGAYADWNTRAAAAGFNSFDLAYKNMDHPFNYGFQLYLLGQYAAEQYVLDNGKFNAAPYTKDFATWVDADIVLLLADFAAL